ncbi:PREDICTED: uncharacterized protein LOC109211447 [Nicotiana attenuata]|uniref:uncharacterized protein LOC109211447 n=1 Tax=Nicotiana attenuata TaxID=49451 RepID=UPI000905C999|nr:PREDICTED: uncharacterized protein LOC109211447 [Nicotiana attenuata]
MRDLSSEQNPKQKGTLPSDTIANQKGIGDSQTFYCMAITTQSGKLLQSESERVVDVEDIEQDNEAQVEMPNVVEVERIPTKVKAQDVIHEKVEEKVIEAQKSPAPIPRPPPPFSQILAKRVDDSKFEKLYEILKQLSINTPFVEAFQEMPGFSKYLKDLITKQNTIKNERVSVTQRISSIMSTTTILKKEDPGDFTTPCTIGLCDFARALCDNGTSINLIPTAIYKQEGSGIHRPTSMKLQMADRSVKQTIGIVDDVLVKVGIFLLPNDFVILDCAIDKEIHIILGRPFLATERALMDSERIEINSG